MTVALSAGRAFYDRLADTVNPLCAPDDDGMRIDVLSDRLDRSPASSCVMDYVDQGDGTQAFALFGSDRRHRYLLGRVWDPDRLPLVWIMLNPSTADAFVLDPTVTRCVRRARERGDGGCLVLNAFSLRSTRPEALTQDPHPTDTINERVIIDTVKALRAASGLHEAVVVCGWGTWAGRLPNDRALPPGTPESRHDHLTRLLWRHDASTYCLGVNAGGTPKHPLYIRTDQPLVRF